MSGRPLVRLDAHKRSDCGVVLARVDDCHAVEKPGDWTALTNKNRVLCTFPMKDNRDGA